MSSANARRRRLRHPTAPGDELFSSVSLDATFLADQFRHIVTTKELGPPQCSCVMPVVTNIRIGSGIEQKPSYLTPRDGLTRDWQAITATIVQSSF
jgi:hypothetical protein